MIFSFHFNLSRGFFSAFSKRVNQVWDILVRKYDYRIILSLITLLGNYYSAGFVNKYFSFRPFIEFVPHASVSVRFIR